MAAPDRPDTPGGGGTPRPPEGQGQPARPWGAPRPGPRGGPGGGGPGGGGPGGPGRPGGPGGYMRVRPPRWPRDLPLRWAVGLSLGAMACTALALEQGFTDFPMWLVGAGPGLVFSAGALILGGTTLVRASHAAMRSPEALLSVVAGVLSGLVSLALIVFTVTDYGPLRDYSVCMRSANTVADQATCQNEFIGGF